ncbi:MAG: glycosyltransferase family 4 protein [Sphingopyxis sp.]|nr:glycosyltransferase family 4 protein [Sphingopyxis sp.]
MLTGFQATAQTAADLADGRGLVAPGLQREDDVTVPASDRVAYLVNVYPKVSHSFIRTEIAALERLGLDVSRFTIRRTAEDFSDTEDRAEAARTTPLLDGNRRALAGAVFRNFLRRPGKTCAVLGRSLRQTESFVRAVAYFAEAAALAEQMECRGIRHVHVHFGTNPVAVARLAARLSSISYSFTAHGPDEFDAPLALDLPGKIADAAFAAGVSSFGRSQLMRWSDPVHWDRIEVVRCAVAPHFLGEDVADPAGLESRTLTCVARLSAQKGLPLLVAAAARIAGSHDFVIDVIGDGDGRTVLEEQIDRLNLNGRIRLLGWRSSEDVRARLAASRAMVLPSFAEGLPVVLMEALALGRPVVSTAVAGIPELLDADTGWLVPSGSVDALAGAMAAVLDAPRGQLEAMGRTGRRRVLAAHHPDVNARHLAALLGPWL